MNNLTEGEKVNSIDNDNKNKLEELYKSSISEDSMLELLRLEIEKVKISIKMLAENSKISGEMTLDIFKECNKIIDSLIMYEWIRLKRNEVIREAFINNKRM